MTFAGQPAADNVVSRAEFEELMQLVRSQKLASSLATLAALLAAADPGDAAAEAERILQLSERVKGGEGDEEGMPRPSAAADDLPRAPAPFSPDAMEEKQALMQPDEPQPQPQPQPAAAAAAAERMGHARFRSPRGGRPVRQRGSAPSTATRPRRRPPPPRPS